MGEVEQENLADQGIVLPVEWHVSDMVRNQYVHNMIVQPGTYEITLFFFETQIPPFVGSPDETRQYLMEKGSVRFECVSKMTVAPQMIPEFINALQTGLDNYNKVSKRRKKEKQEDE